MAPLISDEELALLLDAFGETAVIDDGTSDGLTVTGVFDGPFERSAMFADGPGIETHSPRFTMESRIASGIVEQFGRVRVAGREYQVQSIQHDRPDQSGLCVLILSEEG